MSLEDADRIDMVTTSEDGKVQLVITDAGMTRDPGERYERFLDKLRTYVGYVMSDDFKSQFPGLAEKDVTIRVMCKVSPTDQMRAIEKVTPRGKPENAIAVHFMMFPGTDAEGK